MKRNASLLAAGVFAALTSAAAQATPLTETSPAGGALPSTVSVVGGVVADLIGLNGVRIVSQLAAAGLFSGSPTASPVIIGTQTGFDPAAFGGGLSAAAFRISLFDGDTESGNFDFNNNFFGVDGIQLGNTSAIATHVTNATGVFSRATSGFPNDQLATGWFTATTAAQLSAIFNALSDGSLTYQWFDTNPGDQFYNFSQGINAALITVGSGPTVTPPGGGAGTVPVPTSLALLGLGFIGLALRRQAKA